jgi:hypothetical protein
MALFRKVHTSFWDDPFVEKLTPDEKFFYLFIMTNPRSTECGVYELTKKKMKDWTGYNYETIDTLLKRFISHKKLIYNEPTSEIAIINKPNYINQLGKPVRDCLISELKKVKEKSLISLLGESCENDEIKELYATYSGTCTVRRQEKEEEEEEEKEKEADADFEFSFEEFRKAYPGTKRGLRREFIDFKKKLPKNYKEIIPLLFPAIQKQISIRKLKLENKEFVPEWKHLKTWLNQECWEEEISIDLDSKITVSSYKPYTINQFKINQSNSEG